MRGQWVDGGSPLTGLRLRFWLHRPQVLWYVVAGGGLATALASFLQLALVLSPDVLHRILEGGVTFVLQTGPMSRSVLLRVLVSRYRAEM